MVVKRMLIKELFKARFNSSLHHFSKVEWVYIDLTKTDTLYHCLLLRCSQSKTIKTAYTA